MNEQWASSLALWVFLEWTLVFPLGPSMNTWDTYGLKAGSFSLRAALLSVLCSAMLHSTGTLLALAGFLSSSTARSLELFQLLSVWQTLPHSKGICMATSSWAASKHVLDIIVQLDL